MAVCGLTGMDSGMCAVDISQFPYRDISTYEWINFIQEEISRGWGIHHDGIIYILPVMLVVTSGNAALKELAPRFDAPQYYMHVYSQWDIIGKNLFQPFEEKFGWKHFSLTPEAGCLSGPSEVFFKRGVLPIEPEKSSDEYIISLFGSDVREQGGLIYANLDIWAEAYIELAQHGNPEPFRKYYTENKIVC